ncbi:hypothetical protein I0C86_41545 [Plantactinospora sp. S1510]|uniref:Holin n=1 Tax=Plantactinospora alkalitolerans TaxID=2789879 RepID=A0ABS0HAV5_9ACTN|nr:hypothetical protein [Plantactinospora alkalitolerans]MBF9135338.1 hypothetical protein [Plantactinospora alkalitolerans]
MSDLPALPVYGFRADAGGLLSLAITILLPILVGLITRRSTSAGTKAVLLLTLAAVKVILEAWLQAANTAATFEWIPVVYTTAVNLAIAVAVHFGLYRPTGATDAAQRSLVADRPTPPPV